MAEPDLDRRIGFWRALGDFKLKDALWPEGLPALVIGVGGAVLAFGATNVDERVETAGAVLALAGGFFGVVFAALAIIVSLPSTSYLRMLNQTPDGGMQRFLDPYLVAVGTQVGLVLLCVAYRLAARAVDSWLEHVAFSLAGFLFVFGLLDIVGLARQLVRHGILRAVDAELEAAEHADRTDSNVRRLSSSGT